MTVNPNRKDSQKNSNNNLFSRIREVFSDWKNDICTSIKYKPDSERIVQLNCKDEEEKQEILKEKEFLDEEIFGLQIGKMQKNGGSLYNKVSLGIGIEYMINHTKKGRQSIIQIWTDVGECLQPGVEEGVMSPETQKKYLEDFIKEKFGRRGKAIKVVLGPDYMKNFIMGNLKKRLNSLEEEKQNGNFSDGDKSEESREYKRIGDAINNMESKPNELFDAIKKGKEGIIPKEEPVLENMVPFTSPLEIIQYLAFHANKDEELMRLFYYTKPPKYREQDGEDYIPGTSNADYYGIVEVGLRLYEVLNGISIQGGLGRQRVYDKIISLIIHGEDVIEKKKEFDCNYILNQHGKGYENRMRYPALDKLHKFCEKHYPNTKFNQLYIELSGGENGSLQKVKGKLDYKNELISKIKKRGYGSLIAATLMIGGTKYVEKYANDKVEKYKLEQIEKQRKAIEDFYNSKNATITLDELSPKQKDCLQDFIVAYQINKLEPFQQDIILAAFNGFFIDYCQKYGTEVGNYKIIDEFRNTLGELLITIGINVDPYHDLRNAIEGTRNDINGHINPMTAGYIPTIKQFGPLFYNGFSDKGVIECEIPDHTMFFRDNSQVYEYCMNGEIYYVIVVNVENPPLEGNITGESFGNVVFASKKNDINNYSITGGPFTTELGKRITNDLNEKYPQKTSL